ncbi:MAG: MATE family efflux transporter, partial [Oscillospiraceae bacterium]|nr:MATE family efflux transporter [Oscillospiraceae bacterium]
SQMVLVHTVGAIFIWSLTFVLPSSMRAAGDVKFAMVISVISMWVFRIGAAYLFANSLGFGALGVWFAMICDWLFRAVVFSIRWLGGKWKSFRAI